MRPSHMGPHMEWWGLIACLGSAWFRSHRNPKVCACAGVSLSKLWSLVRVVSIIWHLEFKGPKTGPQF